jgi:transketolase
MAVRYERVGAAAVLTIDRPERRNAVDGPTAAALRDRFGLHFHLDFYKPEELKTYGAFQSRLGCHPDRFKVPGVELSTGSLGHGIAVAVGMALALRIQNSPRRVFTLIGDGESNEGMVWESVMVAANLRIIPSFSRSESLLITSSSDQPSVFAHAR